MIISVLTYKFFLICERNSWWKTCFLCENYYRQILAFYGLNGPLELLASDLNVTKKPRSRSSLSKPIKIHRKAPVLECCLDNVSSLHNNILITLQIFLMQPYQKTFAKMHKWSHGPVWMYFFWNILFWEEEHQMQVLRGILSEREGLLRKSENAFIHVQVTNSSAATQAQFSTKNTVS